VVGGLVGGGLMVELVRGLVRWKRWVDEWPSA